MKAPIVLLLLSLVANVALGLAWLRRAGVREFASAAPAAGAHAAIDRQRTSRSTPPSPKSWGDLSSLDDATLVARLRAEGFPRWAVVMIAERRLLERFRDRQKALNPRNTSKPYWRDPSFSLQYAPGDSAELRAQRRALTRERLDALRQILGPDAAQEWESGRLRQLQNAYGDLAPDRIRQVEAINADYDDLLADIHASNRGILFPEDQSRIDLIQAERRADITALLSPAELEAYELHNSDAAWQIRRQLSNFDPSEDEFKALFKVQQAYDQRFAGVRLTADESRTLREAEVQRVLSPERFADYQIKTAGSYREVRDLVQLLNLPEAAIGEVIRTQRDINQRANVVRADVTLTPVQRDAQLRALADEASARLTTTLGAEGLGAYQKRGSAFWVPKVLPAIELPRG